MSNFISHLKTVLVVVIVLMVILAGANHGIPGFVEVKTLLGGALQLVVGGYVAVRILKKVL
jgi:hypothetical protein